jgi:hypothetical protein
MLAASHQVCAVGRIAHITLIDRDTGTALSAHYYRGEYWVAGKPGARYAIEVRNRLGERLLAVTSVDGVNVLSGATAGWDQEGYVFGPDEGYEITGWRKSHSEVAAFTFTALPESYAARTGRPENVGVIGVALFRERPRQVYVPPRVARPEDSTGTTAGVPAPPAAQGQDSAARSRAQEAPGLAQTPPRLGTGHGEREYSYVQDTEFRRAQSEPNEIVRIRYDSLENLMAMGVVRRPRPGPTPVNAFPGSPAREFVPDPPTG